MKAIAFGIFLVLMPMPEWIVAAHWIKDLLALVIATAGLLYGGEFSLATFKRKEG